MAGELTVLLKRWRRGDPDALERVWERVSPDLRRMAAARLRRDRAARSLQPTELVNEVFLKLVRAKEIDWNDGAHFRAVAARRMRELLVDLARRRRAAGRRDRVSLDVEALHSPRKSVDAENLADALARLAALHARPAEVIELWCFGGLSLSEIAAELGCSEITVRRDKSLALAWLRRKLERA